MTVLGIHVALDLWLGLSILAVFVGGFLRGYTGFGSALAIIPVIAVAYGPQAAVAMHAVMEIPVILRLLPTALREADRRTVAPMLLALIATIPVGTMALAFADPDVMRVVISVVVLAMVGLIAWQDGIPFLGGPRGAAFAGAFGGITQGATGIGGPPVVAALLSRGDNQTTARANTIAVMSSMIAASIVSFALFGLIDRQVLVVAALAAPICLIATILGAHAFAISPDRSMKGISLGILTVTALVTLMAALHRV